MSYKSSEEVGEQAGFLYRLGISKTSGAFRFEAERYATDHRYDPNDMGYLQNNNEVRNSGGLSYTLLQPKGKFLGLYNSLNVTHSQLFKDNKFVSFVLDGMTYGTLRNFMVVRVNASVSPGEMHDYYEARVPGMLFIRSGYWLAGAGYATDGKRDVTFETSISYMETHDKIQQEASVELVPRVRFSDRFQVTLSITGIYSDDEYGYLQTIQNDPTFFPGEVQFSKRDVTTIVNLLSGQYIFSPRSSLTLRCRHYWSKAIISEVAELNYKGYLINFTPYSGDDINFNIFNTDLQYTWNFAPGSELSVVWKNVITNSSVYAETSYYRNFRNLMKEPQGNSFSVKFLYYLDYKYIFKK